MEQTKTEELAKRLLFLHEKVANWESEMRYNRLRN